VGFDCGNRRVGNDRGECTRFISHHEVEGGLAGDRMRVVIMDEFSMGDLFGPWRRVGTTEDAEISFHFLVDTFNFSVGLRMVGSGKGEIIVENSSKFSSECGGELWAMIRDNLVVEFIVEEDFVEEKGGDSFGGDGFLSGAENYPLSKAMVYHDQERIEAGGGGEVGD